MRNRIDSLRRSNSLLNKTFELAQSRINNIMDMIKPNAETKLEVKRKHTTSLENSFSGNGLKQAEHSAASSKFISNPPKCWTGEDFVRAMQLRFNLLPCAGVPSNPPEARRCRAGCNRSETVCHILQRCPIAHASRIRRHNFVVKRLVKSAARKGWAYILEPYIRCRSGILKKPDIIFLKGNPLIVCAVGVHWEGPNSLSSQYATKCAIYGSHEFVDAVKQRFPNYNILVLPFIVGARGIWCRQNDFLKHHLHMTSFEMCDIITTVIRGSCMSHREFMKFAWRTRPSTDRRDPAVPAAVLLN